MPEAATEPRISVHAGRLHMAAAVYEHLMPGCPAVALMVREGQWLLLPLLGGAGGLQVKLRNARGDRVVEAQEFFRAQGIEDDHAALEFHLEPVAALGGFRLRLPG